MSIHQILLDKNQKVDIKVHADMPTSDLLKLATQYSAFTSGYNFKMNQIKDYNWMEDSKLDDAVDRLESIINKNAKFEVEVFNPELKIGKVIVGRMDCLDNDTVWEFKCTKDLDTEHFIQLAIYALLNENMRDLRLRDIEEKIKKLKGRKREETVLFKRLELEDIIVVHGKRYIIYNIDLDCIKVMDETGSKKLIKNNNKLITRVVDADTGEVSRLKEMYDYNLNIKYKYKLMNILSNEIYELDFKRDMLDEMINYLLFHKYKSVRKLTDDEFMNDLVENVIVEDIVIEETSAFLD
jgi:hypothetical protein